ncbi:alpha-galactosidase [Marispirochaeta sp.]|uniref:alpha-galactosidase n=1 Tax=Marispirochaeta sp. TaxID=2038653 RepID=UPI0029C7B1EB|nr:alpha-galactosidase [Marispirochaeta sp.]
MSIIFHQESQQFHLCNSYISYIITVLPNGELGNLYYGARVHDKTDFSYLAPVRRRSLTAYTNGGPDGFSLQYTRQEYPGYGTSDFRYPSFTISQKNGSRISHFTYQDHRIRKGKDPLPGLPATYVDDPEEAETLEIMLFDPISETNLTLFYTLFLQVPVITRSARFEQRGPSTIVLERALSVCVDLPNDSYDMVHLAGAWSRERHVKTRSLEVGVQSIYSLKGTSSAEHNPFLALKKKNTNEFSGEVFGFSFVYSGNFLAQVEVDSHSMCRVLMGIHPEEFSWPLKKDEAFQTPEVVLVYTKDGLNGMSSIYHRLYRTRLARGYWRDRPRPILVNNWEATGMEFTESHVLALAEVAKDLGAELFVLDDGWFGKRDNDLAGLGDWYVTNFNKLPGGIEGLSSKVEALGLRFGLWIEPEMVNKDSDLFRSHPDWILSTPDRFASIARNQYVLDFSRIEVIDYIYGLIEKLLSCNPISYVKWDMNRYLTECYSRTKDADYQGTVFHSYILGVYMLYERLTSAFPEVLFESCSSGGARFDPGILYYAPQGWTSDDTDAVERLKIQYGTSYVYPLSSMGAHVTGVPNQQVGRTTPLQTRGNVALFGSFGYELDVTKFSEQERSIVRKQIKFYKNYRQLLHAGTFYRLLDPFLKEQAAWMVVSEDQNEALVGYYLILNKPNHRDCLLKLTGLNPDTKYEVSGKPGVYWGDELMFCGLSVEPEELIPPDRDFSSVIYVIKSAM